MSRALYEARRKGHGVKIHDWSVTLEAHDGVSALAATLIEWCKDTLAGCRRPYGEDHFDLSIAYRSEGRVRRLNFRQLKVIELYDDGFAHHLATAFRREVANLPSVLHLTAGLFSWGEALHSALKKEPDRR